MFKNLTLIGLASIFAVAAATPAMAAANTVLLGDAGWEAFAAPTTASLAWSGEDESFATTIGLLGSPRQAVQFDESVVDVELVTGIAAPEPPALVLAGMAFGGVLCGRSLLMRRRKNADDAESIETEIA
jgi:hypothetical protein